MTSKMVWQNPGPGSFFSSFSRPCHLCSFYVKFFTLRACPPTRLHAPYLYVPCTLAPCPASAMRMLTPWVGGTKGPKGGAPGAQGTARGRTRAARALGPFGPLGPFGAEGDRLYATKGLPNGIDNTRQTLFRMESIQAEENVRKNPYIYRVRMTKARKG